MGQITANKKNPMVYLPGMEVLESNMLEQVLTLSAGIDWEKYEAADVEQALRQERLTLADFKALLSPAAEPFLEDMASVAQRRTRDFFGNSIYMFTPLYLANYCENHCVYCGFNCQTAIKRARLNEAEIEREMQTIAATGLEEILLLTGESPSMSDVSYIGRACQLARKYFRVIGLEVYPMNSDEYAYLHRCGADYVTVFQETYNPEIYEKLHLAGRKRIFPYRFYAQERALKGGMRGVGFGALLGLGDFRQDAFATGLHAQLLHKKRPQAEIALSCPRLRPTLYQPGENPGGVSEAQLLQVLLAYRLFLPMANITISTRERASVRDQFVRLGATKISAGVCVGIGGHNGEAESKGDEQFSIADPRSVSAVYGALQSSGLQPVMSDSLYL